MRTLLPFLIQCALCAAHENRIRAAWHRLHPAGTVALADYVGTWSVAGGDSRAADFQYSDIFSLALEKDASGNEYLLGQSINFPGDNTALIFARNEHGDGIIGAWIDGDTFGHLACGPVTGASADATVGHHANTTCTPPLDY
jgi:hypothetical protein